MHGVDRNEVLSPDWEPLQRLRADHPLHPAVDEVAAGSFRRRSPPEIVGSGYVVKSLEAALWAFHNVDNFREAVLKAVNLGTTRTRQVPSVGSWPAPIGASPGFPQNGSVGWFDAKSSKGRSWLYEPLVVDGQRRQDEDRKGKAMTSQIAREQIQQKIDSSRWTKCPSRIPDGPKVHVEASILKHFGTVDKATALEDLATAVFNAI